MESWHNGSEQLKLNRGKLITLVHGNYIKRAAYIHNSHANLIYDRLQREEHSTQSLTYTYTLLNKDDMQTKKRLAIRLVIDDYSGETISSVFSEVTIT